MENFENEVTNIIKTYITAFLQVRSFKHSMLRFTCLLAGVYCKSLREMEEQGYGDLSAHIYCFTRIDTTGEANFECWTFVDQGELDSLESLRPMCSLTLWLFSARTFLAIWKHRPDLSTRSSLLTRSNSSTLSVIKWVGSNMQ